MSKTLALVRKIVFRIVFSVAAAEIVVGAIMINNTVFNFRAFFPFNALGVAVASLTILTIPAMIWFSAYRKGSFITMVSVEAGWTFILWVLWLATAADAIAVLPNDLCLILFSFTVSFEFFEDTALCNENQAFIPLSFVGWGLLFIYNMTLLFLALRQQMRGHANVWSGYVLETDFSAPSPNTSTMVYPTETKIMNGIDGADVNPQAQPAVIAPHQYPPTMNVQDGGYGGQPQHVNATLNVAQLTGTTAASGHLPEV